VAYKTFFTENALSDGFGVPVLRRPGVRKILHASVRVYYRLHEDRALIEVLHFWHAARREPFL
jgi:plasmid stabilization system protein ParE